MMYSKGKLHLEGPNRQTHTQTDPTTVPSLRMRAEGNKNYTVMTHTQRQPFARARGPVTGVGGRVGKSDKWYISHGKGEGHAGVNRVCIHNVCVCVAPPTHVGAWSMAVLLEQPFEYY